MRHSTLMWAMPALFILGCNTEQPSRGIHVSTSASITPPSSEPKIASTDLPHDQGRADGAMAARSGTGGYYEVKQNGKTYVFSSAAGRDRFVNGDSSVKLVSRVGADGTTFWVEADNADPLSTSYDRMHSRP